MSEILAAKLCGIVKFMRHIIYDRTKVDVEISAPDENCCAYQEIRRPSCALGCSDFDFFSHFEV